MECPGSLENLTWYGLGPHENYIDRCQSAEMGIWTSTVTAQYVPYPRPQETGTRTNVHWLCLTDEQGLGLMVTADPSVAMNALHYTVDDLDHARHTHELKPRKNVILSLDARHSGLGNGSCGPGVLPQYEIPPETYSLHLRFHPCSSLSHRDAACLARRKYKN
jgi:beta-galactosidase